MSFNSPIECTRFRRCRWYGRESQLVLAPIGLNEFEHRCPRCGHNEYYIITEQRLAKLQAKRGMSTERPTAPGWYWYELPGTAPLQPVLVFDGHDGNLWYTLEPLSQAEDDASRDGLLVADADETTLWSREQIIPPAVVRVGKS